MQRAALECHPGCSARASSLHLLHLQRQAKDIAPKHIRFQRNPLEAQQGGKEGPIAEIARLQPLSKKSVRLAN